MTDRQEKQSVVFIVLAVFAVMTLALFRQGCIMSEGVVRVLIDNDGNVQTQVIGVAGPACMKQTEGLNEFFGDAVKSQPTADYHKAAQSQQATVKQ